MVPDRVRAPRPGRAGPGSALGTPGALLDALDDALENGQRHQRDVAAGQFTMFDLFAPAPGDEEALVRAACER